mmetsp:Transcript_33874/g.78788  ORF Transcript_33874/g.78788 Transcript_33874/m.78788 type:complete len:265 (-) Transcript_33874:25-819(-)
MWQESVPILVLQLRVLLQLPAYHQLFDVIDRVNVAKAVFHDASNLLDALYGSHDGDSLPLNQHEALRQQLNGLQRGTVWPDQALPSLHEALLGANEAADFQNVAVDLIVQDLLRLWQRHTAGEEFDHVPSLDDDVRIPRLLRGSHCHGALDQIQICCELVLSKHLPHIRPDLLQILLSVLWKQRGKGALLEKQATRRRILLRDGHRLPVVDPLVVPRLLFPILSFLRRLRSALRLLLGLALGLSRRFALALLCHVQPSKGARTG